MGLRSVGTVQDTTTVVIHDPVTREPLTSIGDEYMTATIYGPFSGQYKSAIRELQQERATSGSESPTLSGDELDTFGRQLLFRCIKSWTVTMEGDEGDEVVPLEWETVNAVFAEFPWLREELETAFGNRANFIERPAPH